MFKRGVNFLKRKKTDIKVFILCRFLRMIENQELEDPILTRFVEWFRGYSERLTEEDRYRLSEKMSTAIYPRFLFSEFGRIHLDDEDFLDYYRGIMDPGNWHSYDRKYFLNQMLFLVEFVPGDLVECGTYQGASALLMCKFAANNGRNVYLFDSFQGLSEPEVIDGSYWVKGALTSTQENVEKRLHGFDCYQILPGWIPDRFPEVAEKRFCFVHIDVDLYQPTLDSLTFFYHRLIPGGIMLFDDYGFRSCPGAKRAIDEFFSDKPESIILVPTGQGFVLRLNPNTKS